jgi:hypothetical protein
MQSATELYHVRLARSEYVILDFRIPLKAGLLSTVTSLEQQLANTSSKIIRQLGEAFNLKTRDLNKIRRVIVAATQCDWYQSKGAIPAMCQGYRTVLETLNKRTEEANVEEQQSSTPETTDQSGGTITTTITANSTDKVRAGTRPYCRSLIDAGETNEQVLLEAVHAKFPEKALVFKMADVRGCLRNAGVLAWTGRKGSKKAAADA